ncbi:MAG TPA: hypothetical protein VIF61_10880 [Methylocystis sp.]
MHTIIEPFRIKMTEPLPITTRGHREAALAAAPFLRHFTAHFAQGESEAKRGE